MEGVGRFGWVTDPEGNRAELWQPSWQSFTQVVTGKGQTEVLGAASSRPNIPQTPK
jgi:hypothetical protein